MVCWGMKMGKREGERMWEAAIVVSLWSGEEEGGGRRGKRIYPKKQSFSHGNTNFFN